MIFNTIDNNYFPFMVFNEEPLLDFIIPITVIIELISIHGIHTILHDRLFLVCNMNGKQFLPIYGF